MILDKSQWRSLCSFYGLETAIALSALGTLLSVGIEGFFACHRTGKALSMISQPFAAFLPHLAVGARFGSMYLAYSLLRLWDSRRA